MLQKPPMLVFWDWLTKQIGSSASFSFDDATPVANSSVKKFETFAEREWQKRQWSHNDVVRMNVQQLCSTG